MNAQRTALIKELKRAAKKCQVGVPRRASAYEDLHDLLADFYSLFHRAAEELSQQDMFEDGGAG